MRALGGAAVVLVAACGSAGSPPVDLPPGTGWIELTTNTLADVCPYDTDPVIMGVEGCSAIVEDWSGGIADTRRERLVVWGGGHNGYYGNELYALDLASQTMERLNDADTPWPNRDECSPETADATAASRHTYDGLAYVEHADRMFVFGGAPACGPGGISNDTWTFAFDSMQWERRDPVNGGQPGARPGAVADYDPMTRLVYLHDTYVFWSYDVETNTYTQLRDHTNPGTGIDYHMTGRIDPDNRRFVIVGAGAVYTIDLAPGSAYDLLPVTTSGCDEVVEAGYPGLAYDTGRGELVGWGGGDTVYTLDVDAGSCTPIMDLGGPGPQVANGTNGRWRYFADAGVFALVNHVDQHPFVFRRP